MDQPKTLARPYAKAIFALAVEQQQLAAWSSLLTLLAMVAKDKQIQAFYHNPRCRASDLASVFVAVIETAKLDHEQYKNLIYLLAHYRRLALLPMIAVLFEEAKASLEKTRNVIVTTAFPLRPAWRIRLQRALEIRLQCAITIENRIDKYILGGAIVRAGDLVIDGSVRSKLVKLREAIIC